MELEFLDEDIDRTLPDNAMMKIITYQTQIKRVQVKMLPLTFGAFNFETVRKTLNPLGPVLQWL